jgi:hypothetical protein
MSELIYLLTFIALAYLVGKFWWGVGMWLWRNWKDAGKRIERFREAVAGALKDDEVS